MALEVTAPVFPSEQVLRNFAFFFQRTVDGGMEVKFAAVVNQGEVALMQPAAVVISFTDFSSWEAFQEAVAADGVKEETVAPIETFGTLPADLNGDIR